MDGVRVFPAMPGAIRIYQLVGVRQPNHPQARYTTDRSRPIEKSPVASPSAFWHGCLWVPPWTAWACPRTGNDGAQEETLKVTGVAGPAITETHAANLRVAPTSNWPRTGAWTVCAFFQQCQARSVSTSLWVCVSRTTHKQDTPPTAAGLSRRAPSHPPRRFGMAACGCHPGRLGRVPRTGNDGAQEETFGQQGGSVRDRPQQGYVPLHAQRARDT